MGIAGGEVTKISTDLKVEKIPSSSLADNVRKGLLLAGSIQEDAFTMQKEADTEKVVINNADDVNPGNSFAEQVRAGLLEAGSAFCSKKTEAQATPDSAQRWKNEFANHLSEFAKEEDWIIADDNDDDESIVTLDTVTDTESSLDLEHFDVLEEVNDEMMIWLAKN